ncbi:class I SAM-dependent methyltransferase [Aureibacillus halotolerans]|uniref:Methyltransferase family protein n=1 Tax=Aureibacillus halotolerans TaxID=1508390 RepID=A0A4R6TW88_9BACI|nr:class I SAM-dependent methyltransferase [Aureibacillus halotolerans]TDQ37711.1 methyltransferase family protein [Aureibacillus halotolerans]
MKERVIQAFDKLAGSYQNDVDKKNAYNIAYERPAMMNEIAMDLSGKSVLDAGCAAGWYTEQCLERGAEVTAIDITPAMVMATKQRIGEKATVLEVDLSEPLPFADHSFDLISSSLTLHYIEDWSTVFQELQRVLAPGGTFLFSVHHPMMDVTLSPSGDYFATEYIVDNWKKGKDTVEVTFYRRSMQDIINATTDCFCLDRLIEPRPIEAFAEYNAANYERLLHQPHFLIVKAKNVKKGL